MCAHNCVFTHYATSLTQNKCKFIALFLVLSCLDLPCHRAPFCCISCFTFVYSLHLLHSHFFLSLSRSLFEISAIVSEVSSLIQAYFSNASHFNLNSSIFFSYCHLIHLQISSVPFLLENEIRSLNVRYVKIYPKSRYLFSISIPKQIN